MSSAAPAAPQPTVAVPPWTLLWLVVFALAAPSTVAARWESYVDLTATGSWGPELAATTSFSVLRMLTLLGFLPAAVVAAGLVAVAAPGLRAVLVERTLRLSAPHRPVLGEVTDFLRGQGSTVEVRANLARQDRLARVYAAGWRRPRLAVFGPFVALWRRDRQAAEAVLLHELAHTRAGDHLILGLGSPFLALVRLWVLAGAASVPLALWVVVTQPTGVALTAQVLLLLGSVPALILLPVGALWTAELGADRYVAASGRRAALLRVLDSAPPRRRWRSTMALLSHPPLALRRRALRDARTVPLLAAWPLLVLGQLAVVLSAAVPGWLLIGHAYPDIPELALSNSGRYLLDALRIWGSAALLLLGWPLLARPWTRWWGGGAVDPAGPPPGAYVAAAAIVVAVLGCAVVVSAGAGAP